MKTGSQTRLVLLATVVLGCGGTSLESSTEGGGSSLASVGGSGNVAGDERGGASAETGGSSGGSRSVGGGANTGGNANIGGGATIGGSANRGGNASRGGSSGTGGSVSSAGGSSAAGSSSVGGGAAVAGNSSAGGGSSTGGAAGSAGQAGGTSGSECASFSFFVTSYAAIQSVSGTEKGYGGNLGGLAGADEICRKIAETSLACAGQKTWRAFLSTSTVNAIDRVGTGPWYDRLGRKVATSTSDLQNTRPKNAESAIINDLPNESGVPNHNPDGKGSVDNHDTLTGSNAQGKLYGASATCNDWTSATASGKPRVGHSWPGGPSQSWLNAMDAPGCAAGVNLSSAMGQTGSCVGCAGGYGGFYCFALTP